MHSPTTPVEPEGLDLPNHDAPVPGVDEVLTLLALGLARALEARQPSVPQEGKSPPLQ